MADYFEVEDKIPVQQTSVSIPSENGLSYNSNQIIEINVPASTKFINPKESYLQFNVKLKPPSDTLGELTRLQLDGEIGANILIRDIRIYDGNRNTLLEEITDYNTMVAVKYDYETNTSLRNKRALTEGTTVQTVIGRGTRGSTETAYNDHVSNPYYITREADPDTAAMNSSKYVDAKVCLPLHTGLFQSDKILPVMLMQGLHISITLEEDRKVFRQLDSVSGSRRVTLNPIFHSTNGCTTTGSLANGSTMTSFFTQATNNQYSAYDAPFVVGEHIGFFDTASATSASFTTTTKPIITQIETSGGLVKYTLNGSCVNATGGTITTDGKWVVESLSVEQAASFNPTYSISNVELVLQQIAVDSRYEAGMVRKMKEGGSIAYDFMSVTNYKYSQLVSDRVANIRLPLNNQRCKSIICVPTDATVYTSQQNIAGAVGAVTTFETAPDFNRDYLSATQRSGMVGITDNISNYVFQYDGKLQPSRLVSCSKTSSKVSISQQPLIELDKALTSAGMNTHSMRNFNDNFIIGRALALGSGVYDARNRDFNLQVNYQETAAPEKPKLWKNYVYHIRRLMIKGESIAVEV